MGICTQLTAGQCEMVLKPYQLLKYHPQSTIIDFPSLRTPNSEFDQGRKITVTLSGAWHTYLFCFFPFFFFDNDYDHMKCTHTLMIEDKTTDEVCYFISLRNVEPPCLQDMIKAEGLSKTNYSVQQTLSRDQRQGCNTWQPLGQKETGSHY